MKKVIFLTCLSGNVFYKKGDEALLNLSEALRLKEKGIVDFVSSDDKEIQEQENENLDQTNEEEIQEEREEELDQTNEEEIQEEREEELDQTNEEEIQEKQENSEDKDAKNNKKGNKGKK
ncbi:hypothetical protein [Campylobacter estrildidarum]|uniref:hypothetical protein n=1 Tax=Campylobacter estrildidarum TaxID=2510189 RepID=UPI001485B510|nr:hypothetical protein [Campylobacter estrildidarum]